MDKKIFSEKNLWEFYYFNNKKNLDDMIDFQIFRSKKIENKLIKIKKFFNSQNQPVFPVKGKQLIKQYNLKEGRELGQILKKIENIWIKNSFKISSKEIEKVVIN